MQRRRSDSDVKVQHTYAIVLTSFIGTYARQTSLSSKLDQVTGLPKYLLLDRKNDPTGGGYFGETLFDYGSQHFEDEALDNLYTYAQRAFYRKLAPAYRKNPEMNPRSTIEIIPYF